MNNIHNKVTNLILQQVDLQFTRVADSLNNINHNGSQQSSSKPNNPVTTQTDELCLYRQE